MKLLDEAQRTVMKLNLRAMKLRPTEAFESKLNIAPIDLRLEELQRMEVVNLIQKTFKNKYKKTKNKWETNNSTNALNITL